MTLNVRVRRWTWRSGREEGKVGLGRKSAHQDENIYRGQDTVEYIYIGSGQV